MKTLSLLTLACLMMARSVLAEGVTIPKFAEETSTSGISSIFAGDWEFMVGGGVGAFDCSGDGFADVVLSGGENPAGLFVNQSQQGSTLKFAKTESGLELTRVIGTYPLDADGDGKIDVMLLRSGENVLMRGLGNCKFERANEAWGFEGGDAWSAAFAATWEKGLNWPTLAVGNYIDRAQDESPWGSCTDNWLHRPSGLEQKFAAPLPLKPSFCALSMLFTDWNRSGTPSLRVSNDREYYEGGQEQLWHVDSGKPPSLYTEAEGWRRVRIWGMGIADYDLNLDGFPEYFLTSMADSRLQTLADPKQAVPSYKENAFPLGVTAHRPYMGDDLKPSTGWHAQFEDVNNDGLVDLFIAKGNVDRMPDFAQKDPNNLLLQQADGKFIEAGDRAGVGSTATSRGAILADFNLDGLQDIIVVNRRTPAQVWRNVTAAAGHWIELRPRQNNANRDAINGWIEINLGTRIIRRELTIGGGHASGHLGWRHFGLGELAAADVRILWPDGTASDWQKLKADQFYIWDRASGPVAWRP